jgi:hypothetical protein
MLLVPSQLFHLFHYAPSVSLYSTPELIPSKPSGVESNEVKQRRNPCLPTNQKKYLLDSIAFL